VIPALTLRALLVAVVLEMLWAGLVAYEVHRVFVGPTIGRASMPWDVQALNFMDDWAAPAIAIVVIVWLADRAVAQFTRSG
jgi:putative hemolysin